VFVYENRFFIFIFRFYNVTIQYSHGRVF